MNRKFLLIVLMGITGTLQGCCLVPVGFYVSTHTTPVRPEELTRPLPKLVVSAPVFADVASYARRVRVGQRDGLAPDELFLELKHHSVDRWFTPFVTLYEVVLFVPEALLGVPPLVANRTRGLQVTLFDRAGSCIARGEARSSRTVVGTFGWLLEAGDLGFDRPEVSPDLGAALQDLMNDLGDRGPSD